MCYRKISVFYILLSSFLFVNTISSNANQKIEHSSNIDVLLAMNLEQLVEVEISLATGSLKPVNLAPAVALVITAEQIEEMGATTLEEVLERVPGLHVVPSSLSRLDSTYSIRGIITGWNSQVLLMVDASPLTKSQTGSRPSSFTMSTANISRIEIIRGSGSALHGADAFSGTINIITKDSSDIDGTKFGIRTGSFGTTDIWAMYGSKHLGWDIGLGVDYLQRDGDSERIIDSDLQTILDSAMGTSASHAPGPLETDDRILNVQLNLAKDDWSVRLWGWQNDDAGEGAGSAQALDPEGSEDHTIFIADLRYSNDTLSSNWDLGLQLNYKFMQGDSYLVVFPAGVLLPIGADGNIDFVNPAGVTSFPDGVIGHPRSNSDCYVVDLTAFYRGLDRHLLRLAVGHKYFEEETSETKNFGPGVLDGSQAVSIGNLTDVTGTPDIYLAGHSRTIWHASLQDEWSFFKHWELTAGVRYDHYSDFGDTFNPRLALVWESRVDLTSKLLYGRAFRPPSFSELYMVNNPLSLGNKNLEPETIDTYELAFEYQPVQNLLARLSLFAYEIDGLIELIPDAGQTTSTAQNYKDQEGHGFEIEAEWLINKTLRLLSNFAYQRSRDKVSGEITPDTPELQFYANVHWKYKPEWSLDSQYYWIGKRHRAAGDVRPDIKDNHIFNFTLRRKNVASWCDLALSVRNIFDEDIREPGPSSIPNDYPMEGRSLWAELQYTF